MLQISVPAREFYDEANNCFYELKATELSLEHSLISISKWESKYKRPFLNDGPRSTEETLYYIECMTINKKVDPLVYKALNQANIKAITEYINDTMTATTFYETETRRPRKHEVITAEIIYWWMIALNIPPEFEKWHINRLLTLIRVVSNKSQPDNKMSKAETAAMYRKINAQRRKAMHTKG